MLSVKRKILYDITGLSGNNVRYRLSFQYIGDDGTYQYMEMYEGIMVPIDGKATIQIDDIARQFCWKFDWEYQRYSKLTDKSNERYFPPLEMPSMDSPIYPIDITDTYYNTLIRIEWNWDGYSYTDFDFIPVAVAKEVRDIPEMVHYNIQEQSFELSNKCNSYHVPIYHIPNVSTDNYWYVSMFYKGGASNSRVMLVYDQNGSTSTVNLTPMNSGSYAYCVKLSSMLKSPASGFHEIEMWFGDTVPYNQVHYGDIDICPKKYYAMWVDKYGVVNSYGFDGNCYRKLNNTKSTISGLNDDYEIISTSERDTFHLIGEYDTNETYNQLAEITNSDYVYLYDVEDDKGHLCRCNSSTRTYSDMALHAFEIDLEEIETII